jgi:serine/threonine-protein kinase
VPPVSTPRISLPERYRVVRYIAGGGMAGVWEVRDALLDRSVAIKVLGSHLSEDDRARRRFEREARAAAGLSWHPHVVTIYDVGEHDGRAFIVMELMSGGTVAERLKAGRTISDATALRWLREAASALDAAHDAGVVHRDIKPGNLLLDDHDRLAIADFGIVRLALEDQLTATGQVLGTASYISPEQAVGDPATAASDRYALAVVAFELLTGSKPFQAEHFAAQARAHVEDEPPAATERDPSLPASIDGVLARGLAKEPSERWASAAAMVDAVERAMGSAPPATAPTVPIARTERPAVAGPERTAPPPPRSSRGGLLLAGLAGLLALAAVAFALLPGGDGGDSGGGERARTEPRRHEATPTRTPTGTPEKTPEPTATATPTATPSPPPTATPEPPSGGSGLDRAAQLQLDGFNARRAGDYERALSLSQQALEACGNTRRLNPCGYALFEVGAALNALGRPDEAIPYLERRLAEYGNNGEVKAELKNARKPAHSGTGED